MIIVPPLAIDESNIVESNIPLVEAVYNELETYDNGERAVFDGKVYECLEDTNGDRPDEGAALETPTWLLLGSSNPLRLFDGLPSAQSSRSGDMDFTIDTGSDVVTAVGFLNVNASSIEVTVTADDDEVVYHRTSGMIDGANVTDWYTFFFSPIYYRSDLTLLDLPPYPNAKIRVLINAGAGVARCGVALFGNQRSIGTATYGTSVGIRDYSRKEEDQFGNYLITKRGFSNRAEYDIVLDTPHVAYVKRELASLRSEAALYIGEANHEETIIYGFYRDFDIVLSNFTQSDCSLSVEGLTYDSEGAEFFSASVNAPFIYSPSNGDTAPSNGHIRTSPFSVYPSNSDTHASTDWYISDDAAFSNIVYSSLADASNLTEIALPVLATSTTFYAKAVHNSTANGASPQSNIVSFQVGAAGSVDAPDITSPIPNEMETLTPTITTNDFSATNDTHYATDWQIATDALFADVVYESLDDTNNLTSLDVPSAALEDGIYYVRARHAPKSIAPSAWSVVVEFSAIQPAALEYTTDGVYTAYVPAGVTHLSAVIIGGAQAGDYQREGDDGADGGAGGTLTWVRNWIVSEGDQIDIEVGVGGQAAGELGVPSKVQINDRYFQSGTISIASSSIAFPPVGSTYDSWVGGSAGGKGYQELGKRDWYGGGGGAAGYDGHGGKGGGSPFGSLDWGEADTADANSGGASGGEGVPSNVTGVKVGRAGGGVGIYGKGTTATTASGYGKGGSGGANGSAAGGGLFGGGGAGAELSGNETKGGNGAVRIIWGKGYSYPENAIIEE